MRDEDVLLLTGVLELLWPGSTVLHTIYLRAYAVDPAGALESLDRAVERLSEARAARRSTIRSYTWNRQ
ncbi:MAG: hypothetical protein Q8P18_33260 [Pseudomonadota bacterium]|nr:hypothetical protein [Pseudomonadota bacterium]